MQLQGVLISFLLKKRGGAQTAWNFKNVFSLRNWITDFHPVIVFFRSFQDAKEGTFILALGWRRNKAICRMVLATKKRAILTKKGFHTDATCSDWFSLPRCLYILFICELQVPVTGCFYVKFPLHILFFLDPSAPPWVPWWRPACGKQTALSLLGSRLERSAWQIRGASLGSAWRHLRWLDKGGIAWVFLRETGGHSWRFKKKQRKPEGVWRTRMVDFELEVANLDLKRPETGRDVKPSV